MSEKQVQLSDMSTIESIRERIASNVDGEPFVTCDLSQYGSRVAVDQSLSRLVHAGEIVRISRGVFVKPRISPLVGSVPVDPEKVAAAIAARSGERIVVQGAEAARRFGLTTQMPLRQIFWTSGRTRVLQVGRTEVTFKHVAPRKLILAGSSAGEALVALWYCGRNETTGETVAQIAERLPNAEFSMLTNAKPFMPQWMVQAFHEYERERTA